MSPTVMRNLHRDHVNMLRIVRLAQHELAEIAEERSADLDVLEDAMRYVVGYPDAHHHPTEDVVFAALKRCAPDTTEQVDQIVAEHADIIAKGRRFLDAIEAAHGDALVRRADLVARGRSYCDSLLAHMSVEESALFPAAIANLTAADWSGIDRAIAAARDPLFGPAVDETFRHLHERIEAHRGASAR